MLAFDVFIFVIVKIRKFKTLVAILFMGVFLIKISLCAAPVLLCFADKAISKVIIDPEQDSKTDKDDADKGAIKEKKAMDEFYLHTLAHQSFINETRVLHNSEHNLYKQLYHPIVPTPPPNA